MQGEAQYLIRDRQNVAPDSGRFTTYFPSRIVTRIAHLSGPRPNLAKSPGRVEDVATPATRAIE